MIEKLKHYINIPYQCFRSLFFIIKRNALHPSISKISNHSSATCLVIGNGPSIGNDLEKLVLSFPENDLFVVNNFVTSQLYVKLKPRYYVFADPMYWEDLESPVSKKDKEMLELIRQITDWELTVLIPLSALKSFRKVFSGCTNIHILHYNDIIMETGTSLDHYLYSRSLVCPFIQNVMVQTIFLALNLGFKEVNLIGADHSWTKEIRVSDNNRVCLVDSHFYDVPGKGELQPWVSYMGKDFKMHEILRILANAFNGYQILERYSRKLEARVYNYTPGSFIDSFEKRPIPH